MWEHMTEQQYQHEVIVPDKGFPFKLFLFEGHSGKYIREKHWHRSIEIFAVQEGELDFILDTTHYHLLSILYVFLFLTLYNRLYQHCLA